MAVATPVLERETEQKTEEISRQSAYESRVMSADELHNSRIRENYRRLISSDYSAAEVIGKKESTPVVEEPVQAPVREQSVQANREVYIVKGARADASIFRADSAVNQKQFQAVTDEIQSEEENEDLMPTKTTIQYRTIGETDSQKAAKIVTDTKEPFLGKKEKMIIAVFVGIVVALFALVIINSAVIANLKSDIGVIENSIVSVKGALAGVNSTISEITSPANIADFAQAHGLIK